MTNISPSRLANFIFPNFILNLELFLRIVALAWKGLSAETFTTLPLNSISESFFEDLENFLAESRSRLGAICNQSEDEVEMNWPRNCSSTLISN